MSRPSVAIIIPFIHWNPLVAQCINGCLALNYPNFRVLLIADAGEALPTPWSHQPQITLLHSQHSGISHKRNMAIQHAHESDYFACIDSDAYPEPDWLNHAIDYLESSPHTAIVGGPELPPPSLELKRQIVANAQQSILVSGPKRFTKQRSSSRSVSDLPSVNWVIRTSALKQQGGFNESLVVGEDSHLCLHLREQGYEIFFHQQVVVYHTPRALWLPYVKQRITMGSGIPPLLSSYLLCGGPRALIPELMPTLMLVALLFGWVSDTLAPAWYSLIGLYLSWILLESARFSSNWRQFPPTAITIFIGNLTPAFGTLYAFMGARINTRLFYRNDTPAPKKSRSHPHNDRDSRRP